MNILQALSFAGDITTYGNRKRVLLIREQGNIISKNYIDLTSDNAINSEYYYISPNDIIFVEALPKKVLALNDNLFTLIFSTLNLGIIIYTLLIATQN